MRIAMHGMIGVRIRLVFLVKTGYFTSMKRFFCIGVLVLGSLACSQAVEVAPRISDREIIEGLGEIKTLRAEMNARFDAQQKEMNARFDAVDARFNSVNTRFEDMNARFNLMQQQIAQNHNTMIAMFSALIVLIGGLVGFIVWDRQTMIKPLEMKVEALKDEIIKDRVVRRDEVQLIDRILSALKDMAKTDNRVADALRSVHLL